MSVPPLDPADMARAMGDPAAAGRRRIVTRARRHRLFRDSPETTLTSAGAVFMMAVILFVLAAF